MLVWAAVFINILIAVFFGSILKYDKNENRNSALSEGNQSTPSEKIQSAGVRPETDVHEVLDIS